ncbi:NUDIX hydrolase [Alicycliphilus denitrificans]|uniref:NUDIX hydrolase n=1 Tax=Alicycliphilus denitrificans (strain DSM 14773 / CIP 107495 / K601) TaxID=596154 RepID=F4GE95_ALIDK|nr:NUDIX domain-containing protein [Alicycliphilus denitrificans]AEB86057.1 NUDIX hydrolase [Alicycliphilus denitrificans K601]
MTAATAPAWVAAARARATCGPAAPRTPLLLGDERVGSVDAEVFAKIDLKRLLDERYQLLIVEHEGAPAWALPAGEDATAALNALARALRAAGRCGPWRDEQLAVCGADGRRLATVERGAVRVLGLATQAVHLVGCTADGAMWVQQRAFDKPNNPGMWDTLMGGMVSAADSLASAVERETWEEAGLRVAALQGVAHGGHVEFAQPSDEAGGCGYMVERIDWFRAQVPEGMAPVNQDGEVARFELLPRAALLERLARGAFTPEASLILAAALGW